MDRRALVAVTLALRAQGEEGARAVKRATSTTPMTWVLPRLPGNKGTAGHFGAVVDVSGLAPGTFQATAWVNQPGALPQVILLEKK